MTASAETRAPRIALLTSDFLPNPGGIAAGLDGLLRSSGGMIEWHVYTTVRRGTSDDRAYPCPVTRLDVKHPGERPGDGVLLLRKINSLAGHIRAPAAARAAVAAIRGGLRPDFFLLGCWDHAASYWAAACREAGIRYMFLAHGTEIRGRRGWVMQRRRKIDLCHATAVLTNSRATAAAALALGCDENRVVVIHPGVDASSLERLPPEELNDVRQAVGVRDVPFILTMGRLIRRKGFDLVLSAFNAIASDFPSVHLVIAGDGPERSLIATMAGESRWAGRIHLTGHVLERERKALFQECEFFTMANRETPGDMEGFGLVFREAAYCGKASIGGRNGGVPEAVREGETGLLVDTSQGSMPLELAMRSLLASPEKAREMGRLGHSLVKARGLWLHAAATYRDVFQAFMQAGNEEAESGRIPGSP